MANMLLMSFSDSDNSSSISYPESAATPWAQQPSETAEIAALSLLSESLRSLLDSGLCADTHIFVPSAAHPNHHSIPVHRALLSIRSPFFGRHFSSEKPVAKLDLVDLIEGFEVGSKRFEVGLEALMVVLGYMYTGRIVLPPREAWCCADDGCPHVACGPTVNFILEVIYASFTFQVPELVRLFQRRLVDILDKVRADDMTVILSVAKLCGASCERLLADCMEKVVSSDLSVITLKKDLLPEVFKEVIDSRTLLGLHMPELNALSDRHAERIYSALDHNDFELVEMLLKEKPSTTLDDVCALHYAVAHCHSKITTELLELGKADVNHKNPRGFTVLHLAAMRKDTKIIMNLINMGARPMEITPDGRNAIQIVKQLTKSADCKMTTEKGKSAPNDFLCIEILKNAERRNHFVGEGSFTLACGPDDLKSRILYLEQRVALANLLFPEEAKMAMQFAKLADTVEVTWEDCIATPFVLNNQQRRRMEALSETVRTGTQFFPRCSDYISKIPVLADEETSGNDLSEVQKQKRFLELQEDFHKVFSEDKKMSKEVRYSASSSASRRPAKLART